MTPEALARLSSLLDAALELDEAAREHWLSTLPPDAVELAPVLRRLLASPATQMRAGVVDRRPLLPADPMPGASFAAGDTVGPYRLLREIGHGGMGEVWQAERADGVVTRKVALKLPHVTWAPGLAARFAREREILAGLEHPHIARLYDAGIDARGRPYMALEYVEGLPIDEFCRRRALPVEARLRLRRPRGCRYVPDARGRRRRAARGQRRRRPSRARAGASDGSFLGHPAIPGLPSMPRIVGRLGLRGAIVFCARM